MIPKVSVIIPVYKVEKYLDRCMQSVLNQTLKDIEIILVDDGSPDNCPAMCDEYAKEDSRIKVIHKKNAGLGYARNSGLEIATGEYVAFVDSDDFIDLHMYERLYETVISKKLDTCYCSFSFFYPNGRIRKRKEIKAYAQFHGRNEVDIFLLDMVGPEPSYPRDMKYGKCVWKALYSKKIIEQHNIRFCSERQFLSEDIIFNIDYISYAENVGFVPNAYYYYCKNGDVSLTSTYSREKFEKYKSCLDEVRRKLSLKFPEEIYINRFYRLCMLWIRTSMVAELKSQTSLEIKRRIVKEISEDSYFIPVLTNYPYKLLPWKHRLFFTLMKHRLYTILSIVF